MDTPECKNQMEKFLKEYNKNIQTILHAEHIINHDIVINEDMIGFEFYPLTEYAAIMNIPDDINSDWLKGINELMNYLLNSDLPSVVEYRTKFENELNQVMERIEKLGKMNIKMLYDKIDSWKEDTMNFKITDVFSWRGSYDKPACSIECTQATKEENLEMLVSLTTEKFYGWKGSKYEYTQFDEIHFELGDGEWSNGEYLNNFLSKNSQEPIVQHIFDNLIKL